MDFDFGKKLKQLRTQNNKTQEQLATHLNISSQAVSKWERNEGCPDISLLPRIASYYGVTLDELLGADEQAYNQKLEEWKRISTEFHRLGEVEKNYELWKKAYSEYPRKATVMLQYQDSLWSFYMLDKEARKKEAEEVISLGREILQICTENDIRTSAIQLLAFTLSDMGEIEEAKKYASMTGNMYICRESLLSHILKGEEKVLHIQEYITNLTDLLAQNASVIARNNGYTVDEKIKIYRYILNLYNSLFTDEDFGFYSCRMFDYSLSLSEQYAQANDLDNAIKYLNDAAKFAIEYDSANGYINEEDVTNRTSLLVNKTNTKSYMSKNYTETESALCLSRMGGKSFDAIRDRAEFTQIIEKLTQAINK